MDVCVPLARMPGGPGLHVPWSVSTGGSEALPYATAAASATPPRPLCLQNLKFAGMMQYDGDLKLPTNFLVPPPEIKKVSRSAGARRTPNDAPSAGQHECMYVCGCVPRWHNTSWEACERMHVSRWHGRSWAGLHRQKGPLCQNCACSWKGRKCCLCAGQGWGDELISSKCHCM